MFDYEIKYQKSSTNIEANILSWSPVSESISHHIHLLDLEIKEVQSKRNIIADDKYIEINVVTVIKKKVLY